VSVAGLPGIAGSPGVTSVSEVPFKLAVAGGPLVIGFPAVDGVLAVASILAHPGVPILAGVFTCDILKDYQTIRQWQSDCYFFCYHDYRNIEYQIGKFKKLSDYMISDLGLNLSDYQITDSEKTIGCPPLCN
jgi:hypothetical protein